MEIQINPAAKKKNHERPSECQKKIGIVSVEQSRESHDFLIRVMDVQQISYSYDPESQKFEVRFLSLKQVKKQRSVRGE